MSTARIVIHFEDGTWWAESPDLEGFTLVAPSLGALKSAIREAVAFHKGTEEAVEISESLAGALQASDFSWVSHTGVSSQHTYAIRPAKTLIATREYA